MAVAVSIFHAVFIVCQFTISNTFMTRINFGSCAFPGFSTKIYETIANRNPDLFIWTGDITYIDYASYDPASGFDALWTLVEAEKAAPLSEWPSLWNKTKNDKNYEKIKTQCPIIGIWDDHDYGENDIYYDWPHKNYSQTLFLDFLDVAKDDPKRFQKGIYDYYEMEVNIPSTQITKIIDIILLDTRYFAKQDSEQDILGEIQWNWLENIIKTQTNGELTILVSGTQIIPISRTAEENWGKLFAESQKRLFDLILRYNRNKRFLLVTGDIHRGEILQTQCINHKTGVKQNVLEITSSGLTHAAGDIESYLLRQTVMIDDYLLYGGVYLCKWWGRNFGEINIQWDWNEQHNDFEIISMNNSVMDIHGNAKCTKDLPFWVDDNSVDYEIDENGFNLWEYKDYKCYGGKQQYTVHDKESVTFKSDYSYAIIFGNVIVFIIFYSTSLVISILKCITCSKSCAKWMDSHQNLHQNK